MNAVQNISSTEKTTGRENPLRILLAAGGTGGHVYPAISIADAVHELREKTEILFVGTRDRMEWEAVPKAGYEIKSIWISGFHRRLTLQNILFPFKLIVSLLQSIRILRKFKPDVVVSCGGFAAGPVGWTAAKMNIPLVIQEQNSYPGVTNRILANQAEAIFTAFEAAADYLPADKIRLTGNPVRKKLQVRDKTDALQKFNLSTNYPVLLVLGGSGGAKALNNAMTRSLSILHDELKIQVIWQCGKKYIEEITEQINPEEYSNLRLLAYIDDMPAAYGASTLVVTRAGASTCSELMMIGKPSILVPSPNVAGDHQTQNARAMADNGASRMIREQELDSTLAPEIKNLIFDTDQLEKMAKTAGEMAKPEAAGIIAEELFRIAENRKN